VFSKREDTFIGTKANLLFGIERYGKQRIIFKTILEIYTIRYCTTKNYPCQTYLN